MKHFSKINRTACRFIEFLFSFSFFLFVHLYWITEHCRRDKRSNRIRCPWVLSPRNHVKITMEMKARLCALSSDSDRMNPGSKKERFRLVVLRNWNQVWFLIEDAYSDCVLRRKQMSIEPNGQCDERKREAESRQVSGEFFRRYSIAPMMKLLFDQRTARLLVQQDWVSVESSMGLFLFLHCLASSLNVKKRKSSHVFLLLSQSVFRHQLWLVRRNGDLRVTATNKSHLITSSSSPSFADH